MEANIEHRSSNVHNLLLSHNLDSSFNLHFVNITSCLIGASSLSRQAYWRCRLGAAKRVDM